MIQHARKRVSFATILGATAMAIGLFGIASVLMSFVTSLIDHPPTSFLDWFASPMICAILAPFLFAAYLGYLLIRDCTQQRLQFLAICFTILMLPYVSQVLKHLLARMFTLPESLAIEIATAASTAVGVVAYVVMCAFFVRLSDIPYAGWKQFYGRIAAFLMAYSVAGVGIAIDSYRIRESSGDHFEPLYGVIVFASAFLVYALSLRLIRGNQLPPSRHRSFRLTPPAEDSSEVHG